MNFADVNAAVLDLRHACDTQIAPGAFSEVSVRGPAGRADEAAFLRLTAWCYALVFESGRILIPFLIQLNLTEPEANLAQHHENTLEIIHALRTWLFHSLTSQKEHDLTISKAASDWFLATCDTTSPQNPKQWRKSFERLCDQVLQLIRHCTFVVSGIAASGEDSKPIISNLLRRLSRDWPAHQFDVIVDDAAARIGESINVKAFRERRIGEWRKFLSSLPDDADPQREMERLIDSEIEHHFRTLLPISTRELMEALGLESGPRVKQAIEIVRRAHESGVRDRDQLIKAAAQEIKTAVAPTS